jgi:hypothetical protein
MADQQFSRTLVFYREREEVGAPAKSQLRKSKGKLLLELVTKSTRSNQPLPMRRTWHGGANTRAAMERFDDVAETSAVRSKPEPQPLAHHLAHTVRQAFPSALHPT